VGKKGENGICKFLIYKNKKYYCHLYLTGVIKKSDIEIGMGCRLKRNILIYNYYLNMRNKIQNEIFSKENKGYQML